MRISRVNPLEISVQEASALLKTQPAPGLLMCAKPMNSPSAKAECAELLPLSSFTQNFAARLPDKAQKILLYCHHGMRSLRAAEYLSSIGYTDVKSITGGIDKWSLEIDPEVARY